MELRARESESTSSSNNFENVRTSNRRSDSLQENIIKSEMNQNSSPTRASYGSGSNFKIPRKRPVLVSDKGGPPVSNGTPSRPSSTTSSTSQRRSHPLSQPHDRRTSTEDRKNMNQKTEFPMANIIEPSLLLSYLTEPEKSRPSILLLDVRPKEQYEKGFLNAEHVVWIDPILLDAE
jgi:hypothetical protein